MLTILTNNIEQLRERSGTGSTNQPELRQKLIVELIQKQLKNYQIIVISEVVCEKWLENIHDVEYLYFLKNAYCSLNDIQDTHWTDWTGGLVPNHFYKTKPKNQIPLYKLSGYYGSDCMSPIFEDTYHNSVISAQQAFSAAEILSEFDQTQNLDSNVIYVLTCSPGHHAKSNEYGGYCYINNVIVTGYRLIELGKKKIGILDIDTHAGNGTAEIINNNPKLKNNMVFCSIHCDPVLEYPSFEGYDDDYNNGNIKNVIMHPNSDINEYQKVLSNACEYLKNNDIEVLIISFGADTYKDDPDTSPLSKLNIDIDDYDIMGKTIKSSLPEIPIIVVQEGGYNMDKVAEIAYRFLRNLV